MTRTALPISLAREPWLPKLSRGQNHQPLDNEYRRSTVTMTAMTWTQTTELDDDNTISNQETTIADLDDL